MLAVDTNIIVRYLTADDLEQFAKASALIHHEDVYVCTTVLLETEWVLRRGYRFGRDQIIAALDRLCGTSTRDIGRSRFGCQSIGMDAERAGFRRCVASGEGGGLRSLRQL